MHLGSDGRGKDDEENEEEDWIYIEGIRNPKQEALNFTARTGGSSNLLDYDPAHQTTNEIN